jgi:hypothetical protein
VSSTGIETEKTVHSLVGVSRVFATVTGDDDVATLEADAGVPAGPEVHITAVTGEAAKLPGQGEAIALGDSARTPDIAARTLVVTVLDGRPGESVQPLDALAGDAHGWTMVVAGGIACARPACG